VPRSARRFARELIPHGWETGEWRGWAVEATDDEGRARFAGNVDIRGQVVTDIGYALHPWARGRGVMRRAIRLATRWAFDKADVEVVHWRAHVGNVASRRTAWACGFTFHGTVPKLLHERGRAVDAWIASLQPDASGEPVTRWLVSPVLTSDRVTLRPFRDDDVPRIVEACSDPRTKHWLAGLPLPYTEDDARAWLVRGVEAQSLGRGVWWCAADPDSDRMLANIGVFGLDGKFPGSGEIGYWAHPDARGRGVMTEAVRIATEYGFRPESDGGLGLRRLQLSAGEDNTSSRHVATANGFTQVGHHRQVDRLGDGTYTDFVWYDRLATD
jgi:[ribosomal protein S5]-alanine N-acetyltransferase